MCTHLSKRGSTYYFRRVIPENVRPWFDGRAEWIYSLRTKDREQGKRRAQDEAVATNVLIEAAERRIATGEPAPSPNGPVDTQPAAMTEQEIERLEADGQEMSAREERQRDREPEARALEQRLKSRSTAQLTRREAAYRDILRGRDDELAIARDRLAIANASLSEPVAVVPLAETLPPAIAAAPAGMMLDGELIDLWAKERGVLPQGIAAHRAVARWFYERTARKPVAEIIRADVIAFKTRMIEEGQSAANIKMKLSRLRTLLQWAFLNDHATANVGTGIVMLDRAVGKNKRTEFDLASLRAIFGSPVFSEGLRPSDGKGEAAYWLPLLALFTGARMEELGQLRPDDVKQHRYPDSDGHECTAWVISIREDVGEGLRLKNAESERVVPVHAELVRLGFVQLVTAAKASGQARLFHELKPNVYGKVTAKWGEWFTQYRRGVCGVTDKRMVFHSFRHTFKHYARHAGIIEGVQRQIMGHSSGDVADGYGSGYSLHQLVEGMKLFRVPGLELSKPKTR
jgi:integrase